METISIRLPKERAMEKLRTEFKSFFTIRSTNDPSYLHVAHTESYQMDHDTGKMNAITIHTHRHKDTLPIGILVDEIWTYEKNEDGVQSFGHISDDYLEKMETGEKTLANVNDFLIALYDIFERKRYEINDPLTKYDIVVSGCYSFEDLDKAGFLESRYNEYVERLKEIERKKEEG